MVERWTVSKDSRKYESTLRDGLCFHDGQPLTAEDCVPSASPPFIMPARLATTDPNEQVKEIVGSGPYRFVRDGWQPGHRVVYVRNADYVPRSEPPSGAAGAKRVLVDRRPNQVAEAVQRLAFDEVLFVPWGQFVVPGAFRKNVQGVLQFGATLLWNIAV